MWVESPDSARKQNEKEKKALKKYKKCKKVQKVHSAIMTHEQQKIL